MTNKRITKLALATLGAVAVMLCIYLLSAQPATVSDTYSRGLVAILVEAALKLAGGSLSEAAKLRLVYNINAIAREYMHGVVFLILGLLVQYAVVLSGRRPVKAAVISLTVCVFYGLGDEIHQTLVPGRSFQGSDLIMDAVGSMIGIAIVWWAYKLRHQRDHIFKLNNGCRSN